MRIREGFCIWGGESEQIHLQQWPFKIFKLSDVANKQVIEVILQNEARSKIDIKCAISSKSIKKSLRKMKSFTPLSVSMRIFDNPTDNNKAISKYVDQYVSRLTI